MPPFSCKYMPNPNGGLFLGRGIFLFSFVFTGFFCGAHAFQMCGKLTDSNGTLNAIFKVDNSGSGPFSGTYKCPNMDMAAGLYSGNFDYVCINYSSLSGNTMQGCSPESWWCGPQKTKQSGFPGKCTACPSGSASYKPGAANSYDPGYYKDGSTCSLCYAANQYYDTSTQTCKPCPESGKSDAFNDVIYNCWVNLNDGSDSTGTYKWSYNKCYYE